MGAVRLCVTAPFATKGSRPSTPSRAAFALEDNVLIGNCLQRVSPTDSKKRVHTSTATVAVLPEPSPQALVIRDADLRITTARSHGAGGQGVNKVSSCVTVTHLPDRLARARERSACGRTTYLTTWCPTADGAGRFGV